MRKKFNDTGLCIPGKHFMADISGKLAQIQEMVEDGAYFTINRDCSSSAITSITTHYARVSCSFLISGRKRSIRRRTSG